MKKTVVSNLPNLGGETPPKMDFKSQFKKQRNKELRRKLKRLSTLP